MTNPFLNEKIFVYTPQTTVEAIRETLRTDYPFIFNDHRVLHDFISWGMKNAFKILTGIIPDSFNADVNCESIYGGCRYEFESFMQRVVQDLGHHNVQENLRFNLVLTHERLYFITY